ncbi:MAG: hypothetical protein AB1425_16815, partial [Actinomycetota bacterium]
MASSPGVACPPPNGSPSPGIRFIFAREGVQSPRRPGGCAARDHTTVPRTASCDGEPFLKEL